MSKQPQIAPAASRSAVPGQGGLRRHSRGADLGPAGIGNQAMSRLLSQWARRPTGRELLLPAPAITDAQAIQEAASENGGGAALTPAAFAAALAQVRIRDDASADRAARLLRAEAVALGNQILFRQGRYAPDTERGRALIAHELTHVAHQRQTGSLRPQRFVGGDVLSVQFTRAMAEAMTDDELSQQMGILRSHLQEEPDDAGAKENLSVLESVAYDRQGTARQAPAPDGTPRPPPPACDIAAMTPTDKLIEAYHRAKINDAVRAKVDSLLTPEALVLAIISFAVAFLASQFTPVGWAADIALGLTALFVSTALFSAIDHLINFAAARNATSCEQLDAAGAEFAAAVAEIEIDAIILLLTHGIGGGEGGAPLEGPAPAFVRLGVTTTGRVLPVAAETIPATVSVTTAAVIGAKAAPITGPLLSVAAGPGGLSSGGGGSSGPGPGLGGRGAEQAYIDQLKERYPKLKSLDIRPKARPSAGGYVGPAEETPEVGGAPQYRTEVSGAPEFAFEERMRTSQAGYSLVIVDKGIVMEMDGISVDGWLENIKIEQKLGSVDEIVARLRVEADFAEAYGLKGVHYSIGPPEVGDEVEAQVAEQQLRNVFRVE